MRVAFVAFDHGEYCVRLASALAQRAAVLLILAEEKAYPYSSLLDPAVTSPPLRRFSGILRAKIEDIEFSI